MSSGAAASILFYGLLISNVFCLNHESFEVSEAFLSHTL